MNDKKKKKKNGRKACTRKSSYFYQLAAVKAWHGFQLQHGGDTLKEHLPSHPFHHQYN